MNGITHEQAQNYLRAAADGLISDEGRIQLEAHLRDCDSCRAESEELGALAARITHGFHERWDAYDGPSENVMATIRSQKRRIVMSKRIGIAAKTFAGIAALIALGLLVDYLFDHLHTTAPITQPTYPQPAPSIQPITPQPVPSAQPTPPQLSSYLMAFVSEKSGEPEIYTMHADGSDITALTHGPAKNYSPTWSPDGRKLAYANEENGKTSVVVMNADGSGQRRLTNPADSYVSFYWSPDGKRIAYVSEGANVDELAVIDVDGTGVATVLDRMRVIGFRGWSPDGQQLMYSKAEDLESGTRVVCIINLDGSGRQTILQHAGEMTLMDWEDAEHIYVIAQNQDLTELFQLSAAGALPEKIVSLEKENIVTWFKSPHDLTYVTNSFLSWTWYRLDGNKSQYLSTWPNYEALCQKYQYMLGPSEAGNVRSPDGLQGLVIVGCGEGRSPLYIVSNDGTKINPLFDHPLGWVVDAQWSPDSKYVVITMGNTPTSRTDLYLVDLAKNLQDPTLQPIPLNTGRMGGSGAVWQPFPSAETRTTYRFGDPVENESQALIAAESNLRTAFNYIETLKAVTVEETTYGDYSKLIGSSSGHPADMKTWLVVYFNDHFQSKAPTPGVTPSPPFRGCVSVLIDSKNGEGMEIGGPLSAGVIPGCDTPQFLEQPTSTVMPASTEPLTIGGFQFQICEILLDDSVKILETCKHKGYAEYNGGIAHKGGLVFTGHGDVPRNATGDSVLILGISLKSGDMQKALQFEPKIIEANVEKSPAEVFTNDYQEFYWIYDVNKSSHYSFLLKFPDGTTLDLQPLMTHFTPPVIRNP